MIKNIYNAAYWIVLCFLAVLSAAIFLSSFNSHFKYKLYTVQSGSMSPTIPMGSILISAPQNDYKVNQVVTFRSSPNDKYTTTHRIISVKRDNNLKAISYITKGDANKSNDAGELAATSVLGLAIYWIPFIGYPLIAVKTTMGFIFLIVVPATIIIYSEFLNLKEEIVRVLKQARLGKDKINSLS